MGSGDLIHWYNYDPDRPKKTVKLVIDIRGRWAKPVITPSTPADVTAEFAAHGVAVDGSDQQ